MWIEDPKAEVWAGDEAAFNQACELAARINAVEPQAFFGMSDSMKVPSLLQVIGNVGVIDIQGQLFTSAPDFAKAIFGVTDYPQIREALVEAAKNADVGAILLNVNSPGGAVNGVSSVAELVDRIDIGAKPVHAYANGRMASAAYWLSAGARHMSAGDLSDVGSIGTLAIHREFSKADEKEGITTTVLRAGEYKALGNPYEPLSQAARQDIQSKLDYSYSMFLQHAADMRGMAYAVADQKIGQGRVFIGQQGVDAGLIDEVLTLEQALAKAQSEADKFLSRNSTINPPKEGKNMKKKALLTDQDVAAIASGAPAPMAAAPAADPTPAPAAAEPAAVDPAPSEPTAADPAPAPAEPSEQTTALALLQTQLRERDEKIVALSVELTTTKASLAVAHASQDALLAIARDSCSKMHVALGGNGAHVAALGAEALVAEHARVSEVFKDKFKVGGVAATAPDEQEGSAAKPSTRPEAKAQIGATRFVK